MNIDWTKLSFSYTKTRTIVYSRCIDGKWETPVVTEDLNLALSPFAGVFHYAPSCFEGLKAYRGVDGKIRLFRPDMNAKRMRDGANYLDMPYPSEEMFIDMCVRCVKGNLEYLPPVDVPSASLYLRPGNPFRQGCDVRGDVLSRRDIFRGQKPGSGHGCAFPQL